MASPTPLNNVNRTGPLQQRTSVTAINTWEDLYLNAFANNITPAKLTMQNTGTTDLTFGIRLFYTGGSESIIAYDAILPGSVRRAAGGSPGQPGSNVINFSKPMNANVTPDSAKHGSGNFIIYTNGSSDQVEYHIPITLNEEYSIQIYSKSLTGFVATLVLDKNKSNAVQAGQRLNIPSNPN